MNRSSQILLLSRRVPDLLLATIAHVGGITSVLQGGKFGHGFISAGIGAAAGGSRLLRGAKFGEQIAVRSVVGGTLSEITGGKFANGAVTAAFASIINDKIMSYRDAVTDEFIENNVKHFTGDILNETTLPSDTRNALIKIGRTTSGHNAFKTALSTGDSLDFLESMTSNGISFLTFDFGNGTNQIVYTRDISEWISLNIDTTIVQRQLESSTLGSLLSHEIGHTSFGGSLGEVEATSIFENDYRRTNGLPLVDGYDDQDKNGGSIGVCLYENRC